MFPEPGLISYAAFASLALSVKKHRPAPAFAAGSGNCRWAGWLLMAVALLISIGKFGAAQGVVAWVGQTCVAGAVFVLLLSWHSRRAFMLAFFSLAAALSSAFLAA